MITKIINPYRVIVSGIAKANGFDDRSFPNKKSALDYVKLIRTVDPAFNPPLIIAFRYFDTATGALYANRAEYELEQARLAQWRVSRNSGKNKHDTSTKCTHHTP